MNLARHLALITVLLGTSSALAQTTTVNFDTFPDGTAVPRGTVITNQYPGVAFSTDDGVCVAERFARLSRPHALHCDSSLGIARGNVSLVFGLVMQRIDLVAQGVGGNGLTLTALNAAGVTVDSETIVGTGTGAGASDPVSLTGVGIIRVEIAQPINISTDGYAIDDLEFERMTLVSVCGNGVQELGEACDDGNTADCDTCADNCRAVTTAGCQVGPSCIADGTPNPANSCQVCDPDNSRTGYSDVMDGTLCDDGLFCSTADSCTAGACAGGARSCADALSCTDDVCDEDADSCRNPVSSGCVIDGMCVAAGTPDPLNSCMACDPSASTSAYSPRMNGTSCDDGAFCTTADSCTAGRCAGVALDCGDGLGCTTDTCNELGDSCENTLQAGNCLIAGSCVSGAALDPSNQCLACNPTTSTSAFTNVMNGTSCDDGAFCTETDACTEGACGGSVRDCTDGLSCTLDTCDEAANACNNELTAMSCTIGGMCVADGSPDPANPCMACNPSVNMGAYTPVMDGTMCDDGAFCTDVDSCTAGTCGGTMRTCDDALDCTVDSCAEAIGECINFLDGGCLIDGSCIAEDTLDEDNSCQLCDPELATAEYSPVSDGTLCSEPSCMDSVITPASTCMTATCVVAEPMPCPGGVTCQDINICSGGCTMDAQCAGDSFCSADGECVPDADNGVACERANQCGSGFCAVDDGVCCETSCSGLCQGCGTGACTPYAAGTDPESECGAQMCNGSAMCEVPPGTDAGPGMDSGAGTDAGTAGGTVTGGACAAAPGAGGSSLPLLGLGLIGLLIRRRRR
ncbi:MAG: hypothetical protein ACI9KE_000192 [Polyangiales bacterium]|jgi:hypothetical protein